MISLPAEFELISFFECEPILLDPGIPWAYNHLSFETRRGDSVIRCKIEPGFEELEFTWYKAGDPILHFKIDSVKHIQVHLGQCDEFITVTNGDKNPSQAVKIRLKPIVSVEWTSIHEHP